MRSQKHQQAQWIEKPQTQTLYSRHKGPDPDTDPYTRTIWMHPMIHEDLGVFTTV